MFNIWVYSRINTPIFSTPVILHTYPPLKMVQSVPKRRNIKFRRRGITRKKAYNIQDTVKVWNQEDVALFCVWVAVLLCCSNVSKELCAGWRVSININRIRQHTCLQFNNALGWYEILCWRYGSFGDPYWRRQMEKYC